jgi:hypothetical protein
MGARFRAAFMAIAGTAEPVPMKGTLTGTETIYPRSSGTPRLLRRSGPTAWFEADGARPTSVLEPVHELVFGTMTGNVRASAA